MPARLRLTTVDAGPFTMSKADLMYGAEGTVTVPSTVVVIEHPGHGLVLFDTGINHHVADPEAAEAYWGPGLREAYGAQGFTREHAIDAQLRRLGHRPEDVRYVIYSHLHLDHAGGMAHFPDAVHVVQHDELRHAWWPDRWTARGYAFRDYRDCRDFDFLELDGDIDLFLDGSVTVLRTAGHTPGHQGIVLDLENQGRVGFLGDAGHLWEGVEQDVPQLSDWNVQRKLLSYGRLRQLRRAGVRVFLSHDPEDFAALPHDGDVWD
ncbi:N-acyl homoserine lactonase family protein [Streptomyces sp. SBST2-5]|uniref:N-acyl homoserine lactonase family protein n=1 Tax=Streptomyces composti TaxID=2720025 RepID=A0ABX1ADN9_9ACTN|nr:N-acyl homoserine lactonase family protein [Streptomyces composti]NJP53382.1 N-acyl homoserine lactonase family protein [Streptomyces composti]